MRMLDNQDVAAACAMDECINALYGGLRAYAFGQAVRRPRIDLFAPTASKGAFSCFSTMDGLIAGGYYALRIKPDIISWAEGRRMTYAVSPGSYGGLIMLFKAENAELLAIMNDGYIQHMRVGAVAALGVRYLAREDAQTVGILGSGAMARSFLQGFAAVRELSLVRVYSPTRVNAESFANAMSMDLDVDVAVASSAKEAIIGADIAATCTNAMSPVLYGEWLEPGMHIANATAVRELREDAIRRITLVGRLLDRAPFDPWGLKDDRYEIKMDVMSYVAGSRLQKDQIPVAVARRLPSARLVQCVDWGTGKSVVDRSAEDITALDELSGGMTHPVASSANIQGLQFAAVAGRAYELAVEQGLGRELPTEWFLQDITT